jgi:hypothetical protein
MSLCVAVFAFMEKSIPRILVSHLPTDAYFVVDGPCMFVVFEVQFGRTSAHTVFFSIQELISKTMSRNLILSFPPFVL